jgi:RNA polymerase sigma-32 factor
MKAVKRFDPNVGVRLVSFAVHWVKAEIHEFIIRNWRIVKIATTKAQRKLFFNLRSMKQRLTFSVDEAQTIATELGVTKADVLHMDARLQAADLSLDLPSDDEQSGGSAAIFTLADPYADPAKQVEMAQWSEQGGDDLHLALADLDERSRHVLTSRWLDDEKRTLHELAAELSVSPERVRQIEKNAMKKLKAALLAYV